MCIKLPDRILGFFLNFSMKKGFKKENYASFSRFWPSENFKTNEKFFRWVCQKLQAKNPQIECGPTAKFTYISFKKVLKERFFRALDMFSRSRHAGHFKSGYKSNGEEIKKLWDFENLLLFF